MTPPSDLVSVIIPCYRQANFLPETIAALQNQTYRHWEAIIVDDGSPDNTRSVVEKLMVSDERVQLIQKSNGGPSSARNAGLAAARGRWIQFLDGDDLLLPTKFERQLKSLLSAPPLSLSYTDYWHGAEDYPLRRVRGRRIPCRFTAPDPLFDLARDWESAFSIPIHAALFDVAFFSEHGIRFDESLRNHEDWDVWMRVVGKAAEIHFVAEELAIYRVCDGSNSRDLDSNWSGFAAAIKSQQCLYRHRPDVLLLLKHKRRVTDWSYSMGWRRQSYNFLQSRVAYRSCIPWPIQQWLTSFLQPPTIPWPSVSQPNRAVALDV